MTAKRFQGPIVGIDFDNTLANYDHVFLSAARTSGLVNRDFIGTKAALRTTIRRARDGETAWMRLQGRVYGALMGEATLFEGAAEFLARCRSCRATIFIVSHKTEHGHFDSDRVNLREAALHWMTVQRFFDERGYAIAPENVFFGATRAEKIARIQSIEPDRFVDDLEDVFRDLAFPPTVDRMLFHPGEAVPPVGPFRVFRHWSEITNDVFERS